MITEDYVSFETAKLLKEKGFDVETYTYWDLTTITKTPKIVIEPTSRNWNYKWKPFSLPMSAPTLQMAMKWLREKHNIHITSVPNGIGENVFYMSIYRKYDYGWTHISDCLDEKYKEAEFQTPEEACEAAIKYCLENLI